MFTKCSQILLHCYCSVYLQHTKISNTLALYSVPLGDVHGDGGRRNCTCVQVHHDNKLLPEIYCL